MRFEFIQKVNEQPAEKCPKCGGHLKKLLSAPGFQFKGNGWYITDYARKVKPEKEEKPKEKTEKATPSKKSDSLSSD